jgi:acyl carrier protein
VRLTDFVPSIPQGAFMDRESLRRALTELVEQETGTKPENVADDVTLTDGLGMDSIDLVGLVVQVENRFRIKIDTEELRSITRVGELLTLLQNKISTSDAEAAKA